MSDPQTTMTVLQVQHDDAFVDDVPPHPYHTRYFDVITTSFISPDRYSVLVEAGQSKSQKAPTAFQNLDSMTTYEDAIIMAIIALRDFKIGSTISSIKNYMEQNFIRDLYPNFLEEDNLNYQNQSYTINTSLFLVAMKSLLNRNIVEASCVKNGTSMSCFQLSQKLLKERLETFRKQRSIEKREEARRVREIKFHRQAKNIIVPAHGKHPFSKLRFVDANAGIISEREKEIISETEIEMDLDQTMQRRCSFLAKIPSNRSSTTMFITKRRKLGKDAKIPSNRIVVTNK